MRQTSGRPDPSLDLDDGSQLLRLLGEPTRLRLLMLLEAASLTVAELTAATGLTQSRVSTHLARLRRAGLVGNQRADKAVLLTVDPDQFEPQARQLWGVLADHLDDPLVQRDRERALEIIRRREHHPSWVESAAGRMERQYSPGRTWEATARALSALPEFGDVLDVGCGDGVLAELIGAQARSVTCLDRSTKVLAAARARLARRRNITFEQGDMHALSFPSARFDQVFLMHTLTFSEAPKRAIEEAARVLRPGGALVVATLLLHRHRATVAAYDHVNLGFRPAGLRAWAEAAGLTVALAAHTSREARPPYFEVITISARKPR